MWSVIRGLYNGILRPDEQIVVDNEEYRTLRREASQLHELLLQTMTPENQARFGTLCNLRLQADYLDIEETFYQGFALGARLVIEIYACARE